MRLVAEIPHPLMKISVFSWNEKYHLKFELGTFEQTYKIGQLDAGGLDDVKAMVDTIFCAQVIERFVAMRADFGSVWQRTQNTAS